MFTGAKSFKCPELAMSESMDSVLKESKLPTSPVTSLSTSMGVTGAVDFVPEEISAASGGTAMLLEAFPAHLTKLMYQKSISLKKEVMQEAVEFRNASASTQRDSSTDVDEWNPSAWKETWSDLRREMPEQSTPEDASLDVIDGLSSRACSIGSRPIYDDSVANPFKGASKIYDSEAAPLLPTGEEVHGGAALSSPGDRNSTYCSDGPSSDKDFLSDQG